jgi:hypothetical protein
VGEPIPAAALAPYDKDGDGKLSRSEVQSDVAVSRLFERIDSASNNKDGIIDQAELAEAFGGFVGKGGLVTAKLGGAGDVTKTHVAWSHRQSVPHIASVLLYDRMLYLVRDGGILATMDPETGAVGKRGRLPRGGKQFYASPVAADGKVFLLDTDGTMTVIRGTRDWEVLATNELGEACFATPAICDGRIFVRTDRSLFCFGSPDETKTPDS